MKKILLTLFVGLIGVISFCSALNLQYCNTQYLERFGNSSQTKSFTVPNNNLFCIQAKKSGLSCKIDGQGSNQCPNSDSLYCFINTGNSLSLSFLIENTTSSTIVYTVSNCSISSLGFSSSCPECPICPTCPTTGEILSGYVSQDLLYSCQSDLNSCNSSLSGCQSDLNLCQSNTSGFNDQLNSCNLSLNACNSSLSNCLQYNCPDTELSYSKFYVRHGESTWFQLTGMENYYVYLPEYLGYNYDYSNGTDLNFTVGVATDTGYINNINAIQNSKPSQEDLNKLVSEVLPLFVPGLAVILLIYFIFRFIKKVF